MKTCYRKICLILVGLLALNSVPAFSATETEAELFASNQDDNKEAIDAILPLLQRFKINDEYGVQENEFDMQLYQAYKDGRLTEDEYAKFFSANSLKEDRRDFEENVTWKKVSFAVYDQKDTKMRLEVKPKDKLVMVKFTFKSAKPK